MENEKITEKGSEITEKASCIFEVIKDKTGKAVGFVKDRAGNVIEAITDNVPAIAKAVAVSGLIAVGGVMMSCDTPNNPLGIEKPEEKPDEKTWRDVHGYGVEFTLPSLIDPKPHLIPTDASEIGVKGRVNDAAVAVASETNKLNIIANELEKAYEFPKSFGHIPGVPAQLDLSRVCGFYQSYFREGRPGIDRQVDRMQKPEYLGENSPELWKAHVDALRGMYFISTRHNVADDYTTQFNLGSGAVSVGSLLTAISAAGGENYPQNGAYPIAEVHSAAVALMPDADNAYGFIGRAVLTEIGNFEMLLGLIQRGRAMGKDTSFTQETENKIFRCTGVSDNINLYEAADLPLNQINQNSSISLSR